MQKRLNSLGIVGSVRKKLKEPHQKRDMVTQNMVASWLFMDVIRMET